MQLSKIEQEVIETLHDLPLTEQKSVLEFSLFLKQRIQNSKPEHGFTKALREFLERSALDPVDIDTAIFDSYRKDVRERDIDL
jgi:hypothetical protein